MSLSVGIVGLPNVGKSTLFNALLSKQQAFAANYPFATIEPNVGIVPVPDERLPKLAEIVKTNKIVPATVTFVDIAGLVRGASSGEGLGNKFLAHIREVAVVLHVVRAFADSNVVQTGSGDMIEDYLTIETELQLADLATLEKQKEPKGNAEKSEKIKWSAIQKLRAGLEKGISARMIELTQDEELASRGLFLLTAKPAMFVLNTDEVNLGNASEQVEVFVRRLREKEILVDQADCVVICAKLEEELAELDKSERLEYLRAAGRSQTGLESLIAAAYKKLGLISYLTAGELEVRAWTIPAGIKAPEAAGVIHTDFTKHFIAAKVCAYEDFVMYGGWKGAAEKGKVRTEGKEYVMRSSDIVEFVIGK